jgi:maltose alpha-D-glucosyltransferase/alpha-amylase
MMSDQPRRITQTDPQWYRDAIIYETHVRAFKDSNADGIGDFGGLTAGLDYIQSLGVTTIWLLPFYPSPLRDDGYDIADYMDVHPSYGTLADFTEFLAEAHRRGLRVVTELVINHTSDQHPWFQRARRAEPGSADRDFYVWSDDTDRYRDVRIIFHDTEASNWAWDPVARSYYWHRFFSHQPDLNYDNPAVLDAVLEVMRFWLDLGVDGLRLDAIPYLFERDGTNGENLPETHAVLQAIRRHIDESYEDRMLIAEANQWPEDAVEYFGDGDECHMSFHFPLMPRLYLALMTGDRLPIVDILEQTPPIPESSQWAIFLRNHDELTLEMVTEEEREAMWHAYAPDRRARLNMGIRRRLAPLLGNDRRRLELLYGLLLSMSGTPVLYYGDELGMGDNIFLADRDGVRTPMQWTSDRNAGFSSANPQSLYLPLVIDPEFHYETLNVEAQHANPNSLLWWVRNMLRLRRRHAVFGRGEFTLLDPENPHVLAFLRTYESEVILVVANLTDRAQYVELDLSDFAGSNPVELIGSTEFPAIGELPYLLTLGPHGFFWFELVPTDRPDEIHGALVMTGGLDTLVGADHPLIGAITRYLRRFDWFRAAGNGPLELRDVIPVGPRDEIAGWSIAILDRPLADSGAAALALPIGIEVGDLSDRAQHAPLIAEITWGDIEGRVFDATTEPGFLAGLLSDLAAEGHSSMSQRGRLTLVKPSEEAGDMTELVADAETVQATERDGTSIISLGPTTQLRLHRELDEGPSPDVELRHYISERATTPLLAPLWGRIEYQSDQDFTLGVIEAAAHDAMSARVFFEGSAAQHLAGSKSALAEAETAVAQLAGATAAIHSILARHSEDPAIRPEPFTALTQRSTYQTLRTSVREAVTSIRRALPAIGDPDVAAAVSTVCAADSEVLGRLEEFLRSPIRAMRTRVHGGLRLDVFRWVNGEITISDFTGDRSLRPAQRRLKRTPLLDVAQLMRSIDYAAMRSDLLVGRGTNTQPSPDAAAWSRAVRGAYLDAYVDAMAGSPILPDDPADTDTLITVLMLTTAIEELRWEVDQRPTWIPVALRGVFELMGWADRA